MPEDRRTYDVEILGKSYRIVSNKDEAYVKEVAKTVDEYIRHIMQQKSGVPKVEAAILAALNFADSYITEQKELNRLKKQLYNRISGMINALDAYLKSRGKS